MVVVVLVDVVVAGVDVDVDVDVVLVGRCVVVVAASDVSVDSSSVVADASSSSVVAGASSVVAGASVVTTTAGVVTGGSVVVVVDVVVTASGEITTSFAGVVGRPAIAAPARAPTTTTSGIVCQLRLTSRSPYRTEVRRSGRGRSHTVGMGMFPMRFDRLSSTVFRIFHAGTPSAFVDVDDLEVSVQLGWTFSAVIPRSTIAGVKQVERTVIARGAHGWRGHWLVNGAGDRLVRIAVEPRGRGRVLGVPVRLRSLTVSVEEPAELVAAIAAIAPDLD